MPEVMRVYASFFVVRQSLLQFIVSINKEMNDIIIVKIFTKSMNGVIINGNKYFFEEK